MVFDDHKMIRVAELPGMWDRTITIGSAGKTFSVTGWKLGWAYGPEHLVKNCQVHFFTFFYSYVKIPFRSLENKSGKEW
jgi:aspartate/methionine/tyrosine aminotransferase